MKKTIYLAFILIASVLNSQSFQVVQSGYYNGIVGDTILRNRTTSLKALTDVQNYLEENNLTEGSVNMPFLKVTREYVETIPDTIFINNTEIIVGNSYIGNPIDISNLLNIKYNAGGITINDWLNINDTDKIIKIGGNIASHQTEIIRGITIPERVTDSIFKQIFNSENWSPNNNPLLYNIPVENGEYVVNFYVAPEYITTRNIGTRVWDIVLEGIVEKYNFDPNLDFGTLTAGMLSLTTIVNDNELNISFNNIVDHALINGLEIYKNN